MTKDDFPGERKGDVRTEVSGAARGMGGDGDGGVGGRTDRTGAKHSNLSLLQDVAGHWREYGGGGGREREGRGRRGLKEGGLYVDGDKWMSGVIA